MPLRHAVAARLGAERGVEVHTGGEVEVAARRIHRHVGDEASPRRLAADEGCDFDFLRGTERIPEPEIH